MEFFIVMGRARRLFSRESKEAVFLVFWSLFCFIKE